MWLAFVSLRLANTRGRPSKIVSALCQIENPSAIDAHLAGSGCIGIAMDSDSEIPNVIPSARNRATHPSQHILWNCLSVERYSASPAKSYYISIDHRGKQHWRGKTHILFVAVFFMWPSIHPHTDSCANIATLRIKVAWNRFHQRSIQMKSRTANALSKYI